MDVPAKLKSRKLWAAISAVILGAFKPEWVPLIKMVAPSYLIAQGVADSGILAKKP